MPSNYRPIQVTGICAIPLKTNASGSGITQFRDDKSGKSLLTNALVHALRGAKANGGGIVYLPASAYLIGTLIILLRIFLYLTAASILRFMGNKVVYRTDWPKTSQDREGTEWIRTAHTTEDIKIYGWGTIDGNGDYASKEGNFIA